MSRTLRTPADLAAAGLVDEAAVAALEPVSRRYAIAVTPAVAALIDPADPVDPIGLQYLPDQAELTLSAGEDPDPIGDVVRSPVKGVVHRYPDRLLLTATHACAVYCRFCFRREAVGPGGAGGLTPDELDAALAYIAGRPEVWEVILTGGDPLMLAPRRLAELMAALDAIPHVAIVRLHSRVPIVDPERVTGELVRALKPGRVAVWLAVHCNHARELAPSTRAALSRLADAGLPLMGQTVLLKGVNDTVETLEQLMRALVTARVKPYYLHHPDLVRGTGHFRVSIAEGQALMKALRGRLSGLAQPTYVLDVPGGHGKVPVGPSYLADDPGALRVEDVFGGQHRYLG
jgi:lysine 2,3-aminomutase